MLGHSHAAFRAVLPYFIAAYKTGNAAADWTGKDTAIAWYRTAPAQNHQDDGELALWIPPLL